MNEVYRKSSLGQSFERVEVEAFSRGSIVVDYYVVFKNLERTVRESLKTFEIVETLIHFFCSGDNSGSEGHGGQRDEAD